MNLFYRDDAVPASISIVQESTATLEITNLRAYWNTFELTNLTLRPGSSSTYPFGTNLIITKNTDSSTLTLNVGMLTV